MPHLTIEYSDNLEASLDIDELVSVCHRALLEFPDIIPIGGLRTRAHGFKHYMIADGARADDSFVHLVLKIGGGRSDSDKAKMSESLFAALSEFCREEYDRRGMALSLELHEFTHKTHKLNNIHHRFS